MSDYHLLTQSKDLKTIQVIAHIPVPDIVNAAGKNYRLALKEKLESGSESGTITSQCPSISPAELTQMQAGEIYEVVASYRFSVLGLTSAQKQAELDVAFNSQKIRTQNALNIELKWWGHTRDVPA